MIYGKWISLEVRKRKEQCLKLARCLLNSELFSENSYLANVFSASLSITNDTALAEELRDLCAWHPLARPQETSSSPGCSKMSRCPGCTAPRSSCPLRKKHHVTHKKTGGFFWNFFLYVLYSTLLHVPPLRFHCVGGCWDWTQDCCDFGIGSQMLYNHALLG